MVGYHDLEIASLVEPLLTSVHAPIYDLGIKSISMLLQLIRIGQKKTLSMTLTTKLLIRKSCGCE